MGIGDESRVVGGSRCGILVASFSHSLVFEALSVGLSSIFSEITFFLRAHFVAGLSALSLAVSDDSPKAWQGC